jgi:hypothetical protein
MTKFRHHLNEALMVGLLKLWNASGHRRYNPRNLKDLHLTRNQWDNFQKLRYWQLVEKSYDGNGNRIKGAWAVTKLGEDFIERELRIPATAITYRGNCIGFDGADIGIEDKVPSSYKQREDYSRDSFTNQGR